MLTSTVRSLLVPHSVIGVGESLYSSATSSSTPPPPLPPPRPLHSRLLLVVINAAAAAVRAIAGAAPAATATAATAVRRVTRLYSARASASRARRLWRPDRSHDRIAARRRVKPHERRNEKGGRIFIRCSLRVSMLVSVRRVPSVSRSHIERSLSSSRLVSRVGRRDREFDIASRFIPRSAHGRAAPLSLSAQARLGSRSHVR